MHNPIDRRTAFGGLAGVALGYGAAGASPARPQNPAPPVPEQLGIDIRDRLPSVRDKGAKGDGVSLDGAAIQEALHAFDTLWVPPGIYVIEAPLELPSYRVMAFSADAIFCPAHDDMTIFRTGEVSYSTRLVAPRVHARGKRGVTAFDLRGFRHRAEIQHADILECTRGIVLRELCWDTLIHMPWIRQTTNPIIIGDGSNAVDIVHPGLDGFDVGVRFVTGATYTTTSSRIWGGYIQNGRCGIVDEGCFGTVVDGTYFEGLSDADIVLNKSIRPNLTRTQHYGEKGVAAIRMIAVDGATVFDPLMTSGARRTGLYDVDGASQNVTRFESVTRAGVNQPLGALGQSSVLIREEAGAFQPTLAISAATTVRYLRQEGRWRRTNHQVTLSIDLRWTGLGKSAAIEIAGLPAAMLKANAAASALVAPAFLQGSGTTMAYARLDSDGVMRVFTLQDGREVSMPPGASGSLQVTLMGLL